MVKYLLAGADVVMAASSLLKHGPDHVGVRLNGLREWMSDRGFNAIDDLRGRLVLSRRHADPAAFMRAHYDEIVTRGQVLA